MENKMVNCMHHHYPIILLVLAEIKTICFKAGIAEADGLMCIKFPVKVTITKHSCHLSQ